MKSFRDYISEEVVPTALVKDGSIDIDKEEVRASINMALAKVTSDSSITPYIALNRISKALSMFHIILPKRVYLEGAKGVEVHELRQFGDKMGMNDQGEFINEVPGKYFLFIQYGMNTPMNSGGQYAYPTMAGTFRVTAKVVDPIELNRLLDVAEITVSEECNAETQQLKAKMLALKEPMKDLATDGSPSTDADVATSERKSNKKLSAGSLDEAMTRKQKDMAVRRFMSHDPKAGESILDMGKKEREEKKSFASAKKEIKRLKEEEQIDELNREQGSMINRYIGKTTENPKREKGRNLALKKKWGDKEFGLPEPKVKAVDRSIKEEQIDELKRSTLASYIKKAHVSGLEAASKGEIAYARKDKEDLRAANKTGEKREQGIERAANKLAKEEYEKVEAGVKKRSGETHTLHRRNPGHKTEYHTITTERNGRKSVKTGSPKYIKKHWDKLEEKHLTPAETRKKEEIVKSMKKGLAGFKERYGKRAKEVMYATATKRAKQVAEKLEFDPSTEIPKNS